MVFLVKHFFLFIYFKYLLLGFWLNIGSWVLFAICYLPFGTTFPSYFAEIRHFGPIWMSWLEYVLHLKVQQHLCSTVYYRIVYYSTEVKASLYGPAIHATSNKS